MKCFFDLSVPWYIKKISPVKKLDAEAIAKLSEKSSDESEGWLEAKMPAQVHEILLKYGKIPDEVAIGLADDCKWVAENDWIYKCVFSINDISKKTYINFKGLDTVVNVYLNSRHIAYHNDMFIPLKKEITGMIKEVNVLLLHFHSPVEYIKESEMKPEWEGKVKPYKLIRKPGVDFIDYLGAKPYLIPIGVYDDIQLEIADDIEILDMDLKATVNGDYSCGLISADVKGSNSYRDTRLHLTVTNPSGELVSDVNVPVHNTGGKSWKVKTQLRIDNPDIWQPRGYGVQNLYEVKAEVLVGSLCKDRILKRTGFRNIKIKGAFDFEINGKAIKLWGACFAPITGISHCWDRDKAIKLLDMAENANMNILRMWGEGTPYPDEFYDEADKRGILIWQEFFHGNGMQPDTREFVNLCRSEAEFLINRLKHRPSILMWCGGNEGIMGGELDCPDCEQIGSEIYMRDYRKICEKLDPDRFYIENSPSGGDFTNDPSAGDYHGYDTWLYIPGQQYPVMYTEHIRTSPPVLRSLRRFIKEEDLWPAGFVDIAKHGEKYPLPDAWMARTTGSMETKTGPVELFYNADSPEELVYKFEAAHALEMRKGIEMCRIGREPGNTNQERRSMGHLVWKLNDTWPLIYCSIIDYYLEPGIPYYSVKRGYQPVMVCFDIKDHIYLWVVNDSAEDIKGTVTFKMFNPGENIFTKERKQEILIRPGHSENVFNLDVFGEFKRDNILYACLENEKGDSLASAVDFVDIERHMTFPDATIGITVAGSTLLIATDLFAHCVELTGNAKGDEFGWLFEDNYFDLMPGETKKVRILGGHREGVIYAKAHYSKIKTSVKYSCCN